MTDQPKVYVILQRNGYQFGSQGCDYVIVKNDEVIYRDMHKPRTEKKFKELSA
jgi:hypothetical protein